MGIFFAKWPPPDILDDQKSLSIAFLAISDQYATFFFWFFFQNGRRPPFWSPFWMTENHIRSHFSPFQINTQHFFWILEAQFAPKTIGLFHYVLSMAMPNKKLIGEFVTQLEMPQAFWAFYTKWPPEAISFFRLMTKIIGFL